MPTESETRSGLAKIMTFALNRLFLFKSNIIYIYKRTIANY